MTALITVANAAEHADLLHAMHVDRKRIFVDWLGWNVPHDDETERDQFDDDMAEYLVVADPISGGHLGSVRLLPTDRPHILGDLFPHMCEGAPPRSARLREATRLCVSPDCPKEDRRSVRRTIICAMAEYGLLCGFEGYTLLTEMSFLSRIAALGWRCEMLGMPQPHAGQLLGALRLLLDADTIPSLRRSGVYSGPVLTTSRPRLAA